MKYFEHIYVVRVQMVPPMKFNFAWNEMKFWKQKRKQLLNNITVKNLQFSSSFGLILKVLLKISLFL